MNRILVRAIESRDSIAFQTFSRIGRSPHLFYIPRCMLAGLANVQKEVIAHDINSFAVLRRNIYAETVEISFTWINVDGMGSVSGHQENVTLMYDRLERFIKRKVSAGYHNSWEVLSIDTSKNRPKLVFIDRENLHNVVNNRLICRRLSKFLRDNFKWPLSEKVVFYNSFAPYSFNFYEYRDGRRSISGVLLLHNPDDPEDSYYAIYT